MKIVKAIAWIGGGLAAIWAITKLMKPKAVGNDPLQGRPNLSGSGGKNTSGNTTSSSTEEKTNFTGTPGKYVKGKGWTCNAGWKWNSQKRQCEPGGFMFNGSDNLENLNAIGPVRTKRHDPGFDGEEMNGGSNNLEGFDMFSGGGTLSRLFKKSKTKVTKNKAGEDVVTDANGKWIVKGAWKGGTFGCPSGQSKIWNGTTWVCAVRSSEA